MTKRYSITGIPARPESKRGSRVTPATPALVRLHTLPAGVPLETRDPALLRAVAEDLERAAQWLEAVLGAVAEDVSS